MAGSCSARRHVLWKRSMKAVSNADGSQAGTSQNRSEITPTFTLITQHSSQFYWNYIPMIIFVRACMQYKMVTSTWTWKVRPGAKLLMLCLKLLWYFCNAGFIYYRQMESCLVCIFLADISLILLKIKCDIVLSVVQNIFLTLFKV